MKRALLTAAALLAVCACDETVKENIEAAVFLPDGYYREAGKNEDMSTRCKFPYACRTSGAINSCTKSGGKWDTGPGKCGASISCGRCLYGDLRVPDQGGASDLERDQ